MPIITDEVRKKELFPKGFIFTTWGLARFKAGEGCEDHFHDCDEYWFMTEGRAKVVEDGVEYEIGPGEAVYTPMGSEHRIEAVTDCAEFWIQLPLHGRKRGGHLHKGEDD